MDKKDVQFTLKLTPEQYEALEVEAYVRTKKANGAEFSKADVVREFISSLHECQLDTFSLMQEVYGVHGNKVNKV